MHGAARLHISATAPAPGAGQQGRGHVGRKTQLSGGSQPPLGYRRAFALQREEIFLRELISNASDACDRLRYLALTRPELIAGDPELRVVSTPDATNRRLTVADNGIGMSRDELVDNLGTIARSGTAAFVGALSGDQKKDMALIGQFGVGFYSAFMVAERVEVVSRKAGEEEAWRWTSDGKGEFTIEPAEKDGRGTIITLHLHAEDAEYAYPERLKTIVKTYSDHIGLPIVLETGGKQETINAASALWMRPRAEITPEQYREFYHHVGHSVDQPWLTLHAKAEGTYEYTSLLFIPSAKPFDLFNPERKHGVKLYVRRVFITDDCPALVPAYLRFLKGVVDSEDLPLNISREMLQNNPMLAKMRSQITRRVLGELAKKAQEAPADYAEILGQFRRRAEGRHLRRPRASRPDPAAGALPLDRKRWARLARRLCRADEEGAGGDLHHLRRQPRTVRKSPQLEGFRARGVSVLLMTDPVDDFWVPNLGNYKKHPFKSVTRGQADLEALGRRGEAEDAAAATSDSAVASLIALFKLSLGDAVKDVRASARLTDSAVCLVADEGDLDMHLERLLKQHRQLTPKPSASSRSIPSIP